MAVEIMANPYSWWACMKTACKRQGKAIMDI